MRFLRLSPRQRRHNSSTELVLEGAPVSEELVPVSVRRLVREEPKVMIPRAHALMHIEQALGAAFARLSRGELPMNGPLNLALEARAENVLRMTGGLFSRMYVTACELSSSGKLSETHLVSGVPEQLESVLSRKAQLDANLSDERFEVEAAEEIERIKGPEVPSDQFINFARIGLEQIGEVARIGALDARLKVSGDGVGSPEFEQCMRTFAQDVKQLGMPEDFVFDAPRPNTNDIAEQTKLLSVMAYLGVQRYAVTGRSDLLAGYFRSCRALIESHAVDPTSLNLPQALEGALQIQALGQAVVAQSMGRPAWVPPFPDIRLDAKKFSEQISAAMRLMPQPHVSETVASPLAASEPISAIAASSEV